MSFVMSMESHRDVDCIFFSGGVGDPCWEAGTMCGQLTRLFKNCHARQHLCVCVCARACV